VHVHGCDDDAVVQLEAAQSVRREHRGYGRRRRRRRSWGGVSRRNGVRSEADLPAIGLAALLARACGPPALAAFQVRAVAQAQVLVAHTLAASEQAVGELLGLEVCVALHVLEPF